MGNERRTSAPVGVRQAAKLGFGRMARRPSRITLGHKDDDYYCNCPEARSHINLHLYSDLRPHGNSTKERPLWPQTDAV